AGPLTNLTLAFISAALFRTVPLLPEAIAPWLVKTLYQSILLNLILAIFNMFPLPPLYGGRVALSILPKALARQYSKLERFAFVILLGIIFLLPMLGRQIGTDLNLFRWAVGIPLRWLTPFFLAVAGVAQ
ncbi:site-2 protease family protein, partial [Microvirga aerophila]